MTYSFTPSDLQLPYSEFQALCDKVGNDLSYYDVEWLTAWEFWDLANSPSDDGKRRLIRYGHYLGWMAAIKEREDSLDE